MELTPLRWLTAVVAGCALIFSALMVSEVKFRRIWNPYQETGTDTVYARLIKASRSSCRPM